MVAEHGGEWDEHLHRVLKGYHCSKQAKTQMSPFFDLIKRHPHIVIENMLDPEWQTRSEVNIAKIKSYNIIERVIIIFQGD